MEKLLYENRPFIYAAIAGYALYLTKSSTLAQFSAGLLIAAAACVWKVRRDYRGR